MQKPEVRHCFHEYLRLNSCKSATHLSYSLTVLCSSVLHHQVDGSNPDRRLMSLRHNTKYICIFRLKSFSLTSYVPTDYLIFEAIFKRGAWKTVQCFFLIQSWRDKKHRSTSDMRLNDIIRYVALMCRQTTGAAAEHTASARILTSICWSVRIRRQSMSWTHVPERNTGNSWRCQEAATLTSCLISDKIIKTCQNNKSFNNRTAWNVWVLYQQSFI